MAIYSCKHFLNVKKATTTTLFFALLFCLAFFVPATGLCQGKNASTIELIFTSDAHFGISRKAFRGDSNVISEKVNKAMVAQMNSLPGLSFPADSGVNAGKKISGIDYLVEGGDIANRMEIPIQSAAASFAQFSDTYFKGITLKGHDQRSTQFLIVPGNHDITNAIGFYKPMQPLTDPSSMVNIYNLMLKPVKPMTNEAYNYATDKINYSRDIKGIHFMFITLWPDSAERIWMEKDLNKVAHNTPVIIVTHDEPECEAKHFTNPAAPHDMTKQNKFENLVTEYYKEGNAAVKGQTDLEQRGWVKFLKAHPNVKAYLHGNTNFNEFYTYQGPDKDISLPVFRVDSPMKGEISSKDETKLSFLLISIDPVALKLTARECLWDTKPSDPTAKVVFGESKTISLH